MPVLQTLVRKLLLLSLRCPYALLPNVNCSVGRPRLFQNGTRAELLLKVRQFVLKRKLEELWVILCVAERCSTDRPTTERRRAPECPAHGRSSRGERQGAHSAS